MPGSHRSFRRKVWIPMAAAGARGPARWLPSSYRRGRGRRSPELGQIHWWKVAAAGRPENSRRSLWLTRRRAPAALSDGCRQKTAEGNTNLGHAGASTGGRIFTFTAEARCDGGEDTAHRNRPAAIISAAGSCSGKSALLPMADRHQRQRRASDAGANAATKNSASESEKVTSGRHWSGNTESA